MVEKPKRPLSSYILWLNSARNQIKRDSPGIRVTEVAKKGGEMWREMKDKSEWEAKAAETKDDYERALKEFEAGGGKTADPTGGAKKRSKVVKKISKRSKMDVEEDESE